MANPKTRKAVKNLIDQYRGDLKRDLNKVLDAAGKQSTTDLVDSIVDVFDFQVTSSKAKPKSKKPSK